MRRVVGVWSPQGSPSRKSWPRPPHPLRTPELEVWRLRKHPLKYNTRCVSSDFSVGWCLLGEMMLKSIIATGCFTIPTQRYEASLGYGVCALIYRGPPRETRTEVVARSCCVYMKKSLNRRSRGSVLHFKLHCHWAPCPVTQRDPIVAGFRFYLVKGRTGNRLYRSPVYDRI